MRILLIAVVVLSACTVESGHPGSRCATDANCTSGTCYRGFCIDDSGVDASTGGDSGTSTDVGPPPDVPGCPPMRACTGAPGNCCLEGEACCGGACINVQSDTDNCGACGNRCLDVGQTCMAGDCCVPGVSC